MKCLLASIFGIAKFFREAFFGHFLKWNRFYIISSLFLYEGDEVMETLLSNAWNNYTVCTTLYSWYFKYYHEVTGHSGTFLPFPTLIFRDITCHLKVNHTFENLNVPVLLERSILQEEIHLLFCVFELLMGG